MDLEPVGYGQDIGRASTIIPSPSGLVRKRSKKKYTEQQLQELLPKIRSGVLSIYHVAKYYGIPRSTIQFRLGNKCKNHSRSGRMPVLNSEEEEKLCLFLSEMERKGFPITRNRLQMIVLRFMKSNPRPNPFKNNMPGRRWVDAFLRRHPQFSMRTPEAVSAASSRVSEHDIRNWFASIQDYVESRDLDDILLDSSRIFNGDETGFSMQPGSKLVIGTKGKKNIPIVEFGNAKQNVTVMYTFAANGTVIPPHVILPYKRLSKELIQSFPGDWGIGTSASGWMDTHNFVEYIKKVFHPTLLRNNTIFPVIYFVDGHKSHTAFEAAETCNKLGIILIALYPNTTRILQPADVAVFRPLKIAWARVIDEMKSKNATESLTMFNFGKLLQRANTIALKASTIANGFRACGLFPFDPNSVDYSKCLARKQVEPIVEAESSQSHDEPSVNIRVSIIEEALNLIGSEKIQFINSIPVQYMSNSDKALHFIFKNILSAGKPIAAEAQCTEAMPVESGELNPCDDDTSPEREHAGIISDDGNIYNDDANDQFGNAVTDNDVDTYEESKVDLCFRSLSIDEGAVTKSPKEMAPSGDSELKIIIYGDEISDQCKNTIPVNIDDVVDDDIIAYEDSKNDLSFQIVSADEAIVTKPTKNEKSKGDLAPAPGVVIRDPQKDATSNTLDNDSMKNAKQAVMTSNTETRDTACANEILSENLERKRQLSISASLGTPPTPKRSIKPPNYKIAAYSVFTASERLAELERNEERKLKAECAKKEKAAAREKKKIETDQAKKFKAKERAMRSKIKAQLKRTTIENKENCHPEHMGIIPDVGNTYYDGIGDHCGNIVTGDEVGRYEDSVADLCFRPVGVDEGVVTKSPKAMALSGNSAMQAIIYGDETSAQCKDTIPVGIDDVADNDKVAYEDSENGNSFPIVSEDVAVVPQSTIHKKSKGDSAYEHSVVVCDQQKDITSKMLDDDSIKNSHTVHGTAKQLDNLERKRKLSISAFLTTPPTPKRSIKHRNYKIAAYSVLTASERLAELARNEEDKKKAENARKEKAAAREKKKIEKDEEKKLKAEERAMRSKIKAELKETAIKNKETRRKNKK